MKDRSAFPAVPFPWCIIFLFVLVFSGCGQDPQTEDQTEASPSGGLPVAGGTAVVSIGGEPDVLNSLIRRSASAGQILDLMQDSLADMGEDLLWHPRIAEKWDISSDRLSITYHLRPWRWSDGHPLTAQDVVSTFELFVHDAVGSPRRGQFKDVASITAPDSATVVYRFHNPVPDPVARSFHAILPDHLTRHLEPADVMTWPLNQQPLSCGPFQLENWDHGRSLSLVPNPHYTWETPHLQRVVFQIMPDAASRVVALETGGVDFVDNISPGDARRLESNSSIRIAPVGGRQYYYLNWNVRESMFADAPTRVALSLAIDRQRMIDTLLLGFAKPAAGPLAPVMWNYHAELEADPYDPDAARKMLAQAGWIDHDGDGIVERHGHPLKFEILTKLGDPVRENGSVILRENFRAIGADISVRVLELATGLELLRQGKFEAYFGSFNANLYGDPSGIVHSQSTQEFNKGGYASAQVDSLLDLALSLTDRQEALPVWHELQVALKNDPPSAFLFYPEKLVGISTRLQNVRPHQLSPWNNMDSWWIATQDRKYRTGE